MRTSSRISIPRNPDKLIALAQRVVAAHQALGNASPLVNSVDITILEEALSVAEEQHQLAIRLKMEAEKAIQLRNNALGVAKSMNVETPNTLVNLLTRAKAVLKGTHLSAVQMLGDFGFEVNRSSKKKAHGVEQNLSNLSATDGTGIE